MTVELRSRRGFSLPEALIALTISSLLVLLVGTLFLVQNDFYSMVLLRSQVHENTRAMTEVVAAEVRSVPAGGVVVAESSRLVVRSPMATAMVCGRIGSDVAVHVAGGPGSITTTEVAGFAHLVSDGAWDFYQHDWADLAASGGNPRQQCAGNGTDTTGIGDQFLRLKLIDDDTGIPATDLLGAVLMIYRETELEFDDSALVSGSHSLYRGSYEGTLTELATGLSEDSHFEYWTGSGWVTSASGSELAAITRVRLVVGSAAVGETGARLEYEFGWTVDIPLPNTL